MKDPEDYSYCLDCFRSPEPLDWSKPDGQEGVDSKEEGLAKGERLWAERDKNGFKRIVLCYDAGDEWKDVHEWP